ncbi:hypothetical protein CQW23_10329 [Capsicum baccatum]|uniref:FAD-binding PCMH-type domain-containing protein n=1 Tax=Capsicum baccatum TaxID=33114 RepID=A0A2G2WZB9_CAPBA|nr:hypothetical protein CQW23_10329 [Capsicum baccatum]
MHFLDMADPVWDVAILRDVMRKLQKEVHDLHWELAAVRVRMLREIRRLRRALLLPIEDCPVSIEELWGLLNSNAMVNGASYKLLVGNTGTGYYKETQKYDHYIDLKHVPELLIIKRDQAGIEVGATVTISKFILFLKEESKINFGSYGSWCPKTGLPHGEIASPFVRNSASVGGNFVMAQKNGFPSNIATLLLGLCATVSLMTSQGLEKLTWEELLSKPPLKECDTESSHLRRIKADVSHCKKGVLIGNIHLAFGAYGTKHATKAKKIKLGCFIVFEFLYPVTGVHSSISGGLLDGTNYISDEEVTESGNNGCVTPGRKQTLLSSAKQVVEFSTEYHPVGEPMKKVGAALHAAGTFQIRQRCGSIIRGSEQHSYIDIDN